ncbi:ABC transporter permease [Halobacillus kuroshimensis]|uniref:ABC transporter permease n=1 Tax=Halobacillus kuroshimensis TaxID=302481 RepID=A0ABS3E088_9BACI|nr:ABC transporter permease [Halobacillus kuroshimensis]MBN8237020.1 ABC transporter permease [Halobacillus kuroshimensis]
MSSRTEAAVSSPAVQRTKIKPAPKRKWGGALLGLVLPVLILILWETASRAGWVAPYLLPSPTAVVEEMSGMAQEGELWGHISITLYRVFAGFFAGLAAAVVLGAATGYSRIARQLLDPMLQALRAIPSLAWVPLFVLWIGIGEASKITLVAVGVFFPVYLNLTSGIQGVDRKLIEVGRIYHFTSLQQIKKIILPAALPSFIVGLRSGLSLGWMFVVAAELLGASQGLGYLMVYGQNTSAPAIVIGSILLFAVFGKITDEVLKRIQTRALKWQDNLVNA